MEIKYRFAKADGFDHSFFDDEQLMEKSRVDGVPEEIMLKYLTDPNHIFLVAELGDELMAVTSCEPLSEDSCEIHGYILPKYKMLSIEVLENQIKMMLHLGYKNIYTVCCCRNNNVKNFFVKRMGFTVYSESYQDNLTVDGEKVKLIKLMRSF